MEFSEPQAQNYYVIMKEKMKGKTNMSPGADASLGEKNSNDFSTQRLAAGATPLANLRRQLEMAKIPADLHQRLAEMLDQLAILQGTESFFLNYQRTAKYFDWVLNLPWNRQSKDILDLERARKSLDASHYGLDKIKERILEYLAVLILQKQRGGDTRRAPILCFVGLVGTGKTTMAAAIAQALGRKFIRIPFGGLGDPFYLRGQSRFYPYAGPGRIIRGLRQVGVRNPVILLDEIDRVADDALNTIMGVLVELLDPEQNQQFMDHFIDYPFDLSQVLFVATANNTSRIATAVMDRIEPLSMPSYSDQEKIVIGKKYLLPEAMKESGLRLGELTIADACWPLIVRPLGFDAGVRTLKRNIERICRRTAMLIVSGRDKKVAVTPENIKKFLPSW